MSGYNLKKNCIFYLKISFTVTLNKHCRCWWYVTLCSTPCGSSPFGFPYTKEKTKFENIFENLRFLIYFPAPEAINKFLWIGIAAGGVFVLVLVIIMAKFVIGKLWGPQIKWYLRSRITFIGPKPAVGKHLLAWVIFHDSVVVCWLFKKI